MKNRSQNTKIYWEASKYVWKGSYDPKCATGIISQPVPNEVELLVDRLLRNGGKYAFVQFVESPIICQLLYEKGNIVPFKKIFVRRGETNSCYDDAFRLWTKDRIKYQLIFGYALSDMFWFNHCWVREKNGTIVDTKVQCEKYYGVSVDESLADLFQKIYCRY